MFPPTSTDSVLITASFAENPVISAVAALQSVKPNGLNIGETSCPINASILIELSVTTFSLVSKVCKNHMITDAVNIIVNAFVMKSFALSHISITTDLRARHTVVRQFHNKRHRLAVEGSLFQHKTDKHSHDRYRIYIKISS